MTTNVLYLIRLHLGVHFISYISLSSGGGTKSATTKPQLRDLMDALYHKVADKWKMIGVLIEIPKGTLAAIAGDVSMTPTDALLRCWRCGWSESTLLPLGPP